MSVSLLAAAAIAASLLLARRIERPAQALVPAGETVPVNQSLDAIREAGLSVASLPWQVARSSPLGRARRRLCGCLHTCAFRGGRHRVGHGYPADEWSWMIFHPPGVRRQTSVKLPLSAGAPLARVVRWKRPVISA